MSFRELRNGRKYDRVKLSINHIVGNFTSDFSMFFSQFPIGVVRMVRDANSAVKLPVLKRQFSFLLAV